MKIRIHTLLYSFHEYVKGVYSFSRVYFKFLKVTITLSDSIYKHIKTDSFITGSTEVRDTGSYTCHADNGVGEARKLFNLIVQGELRFIL